MFCNTIAQLADMVLRRRKSTRWAMSDEPTHALQHDRPDEKGKTAAQAV